MIVQDVRYALRSLRRAPGFAAASVLTLALGIGGNAAMFSLVDRVVLRALPFPDSSRLVRVRDAVLGAGGQVYRGNLTPARWDAIRARAGAFDRWTAQRAESLTWIARDGAAPLEGASVSPGTFELLGAVPVRGRVFTPEEERQGGESGVAVVSEDFWRSRLGSDESVLGRSLRLADRTRTIVGVLPRGFHFPYHAEVWLPLRVDPADGRDLLTIGRLAPGKSLEITAAEMADLARRFDAQDPAARGRSIDVMPLKQDLLRGEERVPLALLGSVGFLLLLACANLAALLLSRSVARQREIAIRAALGASRARRLRQLLIESVVLALAGGVAGLALGAAGSTLLSGLVPRVLGEELGLSASSGRGSIAIFSIVLSCLAGLLFGSIPAWLASRANPSDVLRQEGRSGSMSAGNRRLLGSFVAAEVAFATLLLAGAAFLLSDVARRQRRPLGVETAGLLSVEVPLPPESSGPDRTRAVAKILAAARSAPGVFVAAATSVNPFWGGTWGMGIVPEGAPGDASKPSSVNVRFVTPGLLRAWGTPLQSGRDFSDADQPGSPDVAIISRRLARRFWKDADPVGRTILRQASGRQTARMTVIGVAGEVLDESELTEAIYLPYAQRASTPGAERVFLMIRGEASGGAWMAGALAAIRRADPKVAIGESELMSRLYARTLSGSRLGASILAGFAAFGLLLATIGVFGLVAFLAGQRRQEIGIRVALGAGPSQVRSLLLGHGFRLAAAGCGAGLALSYPAWRLLTSQLSDFSAPPALALCVAAALLAIAAAASDVPARRAARAAPTEMLRNG
ncbi:MAG: ADOP family duplicated permease [Acidobacteriota bacterium]|nr:ADOP family duplicated permease [Acidobacteriota bacterium]